MPYSRIFCRNMEFRNVKPTLQCYMQVNEYRIEFGNTFGVTDNDILTNVSQALANQRFVSECSTDETYISIIYQS